MPMPRTSAGLLLHRRTGSGAIEVFLVHPGGPFWVRKDDGAWTIPKGEPGEGEDPLAAAVREFAEETGFTVEGPFTELPPVRQKGGKVVTAFAVEGDCDPAALVSSTFPLEWPPRSGRVLQVPEVDRGGWFGLEEARVKLLSGQVPLLDHLAAAAP